MMVHQDIVPAEIVVLQTNSRKCWPSEVGGTPGARAGLLCNAATGELFDEVGFLPVARYHELDPTTGKFGLFGLVVPDWDDATAIARVYVPFSKGQVVGYRRFMTCAIGLRYLRPGTNEAVQPPIWAHKYRLTPQLASNRKWEWYSLALVLAERPPVKSLIGPSDLLYRAAKEFRETILGGKRVN